VKTLGNLLTGFILVAVIVVVLVIVVGNATDGPRPLPMPIPKPTPTPHGPVPEPLSLPFLGWWVAIMATVGLSILFVGWPASFVRRRWADAGRVWADVRTRMFPAVPKDGPEFDAYLNERLAQIASAIASHEGSLGGTGSAWRRLLDAPEPETLQLAAPEPELPTEVHIQSALLPAGQLALPIGITANGPLALPLRNLGNGVVGGLQGTGKSECLSAMMAGLLRQDASGRQLQIAVADMKGGVDFGRIPADLAALWQPVARELSEAQALIAALMAEVERRNRLLAEANVANIEAANRAGANLPYLLAFVDEIAFLTMPANERAQEKELRELSQTFISAAVRVSMVGRAAGVALVMATQRPSAAVIPTMLRDLAGWRIAFRCRNPDSSRAVLDEAGAEALPSVPGRCLVSAGGGAVLAQSYMSDIEHGHFDAFLARLPRRYGAQPLPKPDSIPELGDVSTAGISERIRQMIAEAEGAAGGVLEAPTTGLQPESAPETPLWDVPGVETTGLNQWTPGAKLPLGPLPPEAAAWVRANIVPNTRRGINFASDFIFGYGGVDPDGYVWAALRGEV
jgi:FtsK/SpoIIIE family